MSGAARSSELVKVFRALEISAEEADATGGGGGGRAPSALFAEALGIDPLLLEQPLPIEMVLEASHGN